MTIDTRQAAIARALGAITARTEDQVNRQRNQILQQYQGLRPTFYRGGGKIAGLGGSAYRPTGGNQSAGGSRIGARVGNAGGIVTTQPAVGGVGAVDISGLEDAVRQIRRALGAQYTTAADPNSPLIQPRHNADIVVTESDGTWVWDPATEAWLQGAGGGGGAGVIYNAGDPNADGVTPISGFCFDTDALRMFVANNSDPNAPGIAWVPTSSKLFIEGEAATTDTYYEGDFWATNPRCLDFYTGGEWRRVTVGCIGDPGPSGGPVSD